MTLQLRPLQPGDENDASRAHTELAKDNFPFLLEDWDPTLPWADYLGRLDNVRRGIDLAPDRVPATFLVAIAGDDLVGRVSIRHELNDYLRNFAGHIGYGVRPVRQAVIIARTVGVDRVLVTCSDNNVPSAIVIERNGGVLEDIRTDESNGTRKRRYWID